MSKRKLKDIDMDVEQIFSELVDQNEEPKFSYADTIVKGIENEYQNLPDVKAERKKEKEGLSKKLKDLQGKLKKVKNVKNHRAVEQNTKKAELRSRLRKEIEDIKDKLHAIDLEEKGSEVTSNQLMDETLKSTSKK